MGGVINIITRQGKETPAGVVEAGAGSWGEQRFKAGISGKTGSVDFAGSMAYISRDDYELGNGDTYENSDVQDRVRYSFNAGWNFNDNHRLGLILQGSDTNDAGKGEDAAKSYYYYTRQNRDNHTLDFSYKGCDETGSTTWLTRYFQGEVNYDLKRFTNPAPPGCRCQTIPTGSRVPRPRSAMILGCYVPLPAWTGWLMNLISARTVMLPAHRRRTLPKVILTISAVF